jgi:hypothetical protein
VVFFAPKQAQKRGHDLLPCDGPCFDSKNFASNALAAEQQQQQQAEHVKAQQELERYFKEFFLSLSVLTIEKRQV